jgi:Leucine-rich repeat (LRR) protein
MSPSGEMHWLEELSLIGNDIKQIPWSYGKMKSLAKLEITGCHPVHLLG